MDARIAAYTKITNRNGGTNFTEGCPESDINVLPSLYYGSLIV